MSLDGFIAGPNGEADWITMDPDIDFHELFRNFDAVLMGRKTYDAARAQHGGGGMPGMQVYVISRTLRQEDCRGVTVSSDPAATVAALKSAPGKDIWLFGGGDLLRSFLQLDLVDSLEVAVIPVLLGGGIRLLPDPAPRSSLRLAKHHLYPKTGTLLLEYEVTRQPPRDRRRPRARRAASTSTGREAGR
jgi:dihydrofolate reductase